MIGRQLLPACLLFAAGCQSLALPLPSPKDSNEARQLWEKGQVAMRRGRSDEAIALYERSLALDPAQVRNHLSLAAAYLERGDEAAACPHLGRYVEAHPEEAMVRAHYAELLCRLHDDAEAQAQLNRFVADAQEQGGPAAERLLHSHSRLMEIAERDEDDYGEHLHRGIALLLLARARAELGEQDGELDREALLCRAAAELTRARLEDPAEARPHWYLYEVWSMLGQHQPAIHALHAAVTAAPLSDLTPAERRSLQLAYDTHRAELARR